MFFGETKRFANLLFLAVLKNILKKAENLDKNLKLSSNS